MSINLVDKKCISTEWYTPREILEPVRELFRGSIEYDPCTNKNNPVKARFFSTHAGLSSSWLDNTFCNPPYGKNLYPWIEKVVTQAKKKIKIVLLLSASSRWDQRKWQKLYSKELTTFVMPIGRVKFLDSNGKRHKSPPYPSILYFYNIDPLEVKRYFGEIGTVVEQKVI